MEDVTFTYSGEKEPAIKDINLRMKKSEVVLITGQAGAGKTTLCHCLNGLIPHYYDGDLKGRVLVKGMDTKRLPVAYLSSYVGRLFQDPVNQLFCSKVEDEVAFGPQYLGMEVEEINRRVKDCIDYVRLNGYENVSPFSLSGGQKQACALAAILAMNTDILVLDEPTSELDPLGSREILSIILKIVKEQKKTALIVEHKLSELWENVDRIVVMDRGEILLNGKPESLFQQVEKLEQLGLKVPEAMLLMNRLKKERLISFQQTARSEDEIFKILIENLSKKQKLRNQPANRSMKNINETIENVNEKKPVIQVNELHFTYPGGTQALRGINLTIYAGECVAILGQNGSGKTTLTKHFNGLLKPSKGTVIVYGHDTRNTPITTLCSLVGYVFQNPDDQIFCRKVRDELAFGPKNLGIKREEIDKRVETIARKLGIEEYLDENPYNLSKGLRQRVAIASVLTMDPDTLVIDEPTTGQDFKRGLMIMEMAQVLNNEGKTIIVITHDMELAARYADRAIVLSKGKILLDGSPRYVFSCVDKLKETYLAPPQATRIAQRLQQFIPSNLLTIDEVFAELRSILRS